MSNHFTKVKQYLQELELPITKEIAEDEIVIVNDEENGIKNLVIDCEYPILVVEQVIMPVPKNPGDLFKRLLQMNRTLVHGAFVIDSEGKTVIYRDTLQLENLDLNELEATIKSLSIALFENMDELLLQSKK
jgi:hypothetical protein